MASKNGLLSSFSHSLYTNKCNWIFSVTIDNLNFIILQILLQELHIHIQQLAKFCLNSSTLIKLQNLPFLR
ncbi:Uncharacterized protein TCM_042745 [Theobroma cacao]|uniref:Uncharacterized protein n=1 Tax=Theobroma cacao TaxID=3641 RepID=A0A061FM10_THECC|nr:Uncharacterized protein TCM_042745 [Theobroma cacao]